MKMLLSASLVTALLAPAVPAQEPDEAAQAKEAFIKKADDLIYDDNYDSASSARYKVKTDDPRLLANRALELLDGFGAFFESYWSGKIDLRPYDQIGRLYLFYSRYKYKKLFDDASQIPEGGVGHYRVMIDIVAAHTDSVGPELPDVLIHEAAHQLIHQRLYGSEASPAPWVSEGMACYFEHMQRDRSGTFKVSEIGGKSTGVFKEAPKGGQGLGPERLRRYAQALKSKEAGSLDETIKIKDDASFYAGGAEERYAASWLLVHFLWHADEGRHAAGFVKYLKREIQEGPDPAAFYEAIGMSPQQLQASFEVYVKKL